MHLTEQQQVIVEHNYGYARVFAVAGAGKTTAMVHRIRRLVGEHIFPPQKILATSFSNASVRDIEKELEKWAECSEVKTRTLHQVGNYVIKVAKKYGYLNDFVNSKFELDKGDAIILNEALSEARKRNVLYKKKLDDIDREDFISYISNCKGNLMYADLQAAQLSPEALQLAKQAKAPPDEFEWYLDFYKIFEQIRLQNGWITFNDMLMTGWELLVKHSDLLNKVRSHVECVIVDEFQDVNLAQFEILDLITSVHRNYMVIGDDDQTIYEWRGASARFILEEFKNRYQPKDYLVSDNFRCTASQIVLANEIIKHNCERYSKHLSLTKGFDGSTIVHHDESLEEMGRNVVCGVKAALDAGVKLADIAILVRVHAQTPHIEQFLIKEGIPYGGPGLVPFYQRPEVVNLLSYCRLVNVELALSSGKLPTLSLIREFKQAWEDARTVPPIRYLSKDIKQKIHDAVVLEQSCISSVLLDIKAEIQSSAHARQIEKLASWLFSTSKADSAEEVLRQLESYLEYRKSLVSSSGFAETGEGRATNIEAFLDYAQGKGNLFEFLQHLAQLATDRLNQNNKGKKDEVRLTTIHQSKGLEWQVVFIPNCNQETIPFGKKILPEKLKEERRLFYVAITRSKRELHIHLLRNKAPSQFLKEANYKQILESIDKFQNIFAGAPHLWNATDVIYLTKCIDDFHLERYFRQWWDTNVHKKEQIAQTMQRFFAVADQRQLLSVLKINLAQFELWRSIARVQHHHSLGFPGFEQFVLQLKSNRISSIHKNSENLFAKLQQGSNVNHPQYGKGIVLKVIGYARYEIITIDFYTCGIKRVQINPDLCSLIRA